MSPIARSHGKDLAFLVDDSGGTLRDISAHVTGVSGLPGSRALDDVTAAGDGGDKSIPGLFSGQFTVSGWWDDTASTGSHTVLNGLRTTTATSSFEYGPEGSASGDIKLSGECWLESLTYDAEVRGAVPFSATFKVDGTLTTGTFS